MDKLIELIDIASYVLVLLQRGALREGIPKRSLGTRNNIDPTFRFISVSEI